MPDRFVFPTLFMLLLVICFNLNHVYAQQLYINEVMAKNAATIEDEDGDTEDWLELYYNGSEPIDLEGYAISDDETEPFHWILPDIEMQPGEYLLIWASDKDRRDPAAPLHTNFQITSDGERLTLYSPDTTLVDEAPATELSTGLSLGRQPDGSSNWYFFDAPTPGAANRAKGYQGELDALDLTHDSGFYTGGFHLSISSPEPGVTIYYTLDGSTPTTESREYSGSILIEDRGDEQNDISEIPTNRDYNWQSPDGLVEKATVVRAIAVKPGYVHSPVQTQSYFVFPEGADRYTLPVVSIAADREDFFSESSGIYVPGIHYEYGSNGWNQQGNFTQRGDAWERPVYFEMFDEQGNLFFEAGAGVRVHGGITRAYPQKSLRFYAREEYGTDLFYHQLFPHRPYDEYDRFLLRNAGNDWERALFRDAMVQELVGHMNIATQAYRPFIVFLNGEYWGIHNLRDRIDEDFIGRVYDVDEDEVDHLGFNGEIMQGDSIHYRETIEYMENHDLSENRHFEYVNTRIDVENFMDYQIANIFVGNTDWPGNNIEYWRYQADEYDPEAGYEDGRWRWMAFDMDFGFSLYSADAGTNMLNFATDPHCGCGDYPNPPWSTFLLRTLLDNNDFKKAFINRFADQLNTAFKSGRMLELIDRFQARIRPEMPEQIDRWGRPYSINYWQNQVDEIRSFAETRPGYVWQHLAEKFDLDERYTLTVNVSDTSRGMVRVNTLEISPQTTGVADQPYPWSGSYFRDVPVTLEAVSKKGFAFSHWDGGGDLPDLARIELTPGGDTSVRAVFNNVDTTKIHPKAYAMSEGLYTFEYWGADEKPNTYPPNMSFVYMDEEEPGLDADIAGLTYGAYNLESRTRINGLGDGGFSFVNTGNEEGNVGYPGTHLGGAILAMNTTDYENMEVTWTSGTLEPNSRIYNLRLQYRVGRNGSFNDVLDDNGDPVEYLCNEQAGHSETIGPVALPDVVNDKEYIQLLWRYYYTGERLDEKNGQRSRLSISSIGVTADKIVAIDEKDRALPGQFELRQNYPNPFNPATVIHYKLPRRAHVRVEVFTPAGRHVATLVDEIRPAGEYEVAFNAADMGSGVYLYRLQTEHFSQTRKMLLIK